MKFMIFAHASQQYYDRMTGKAADGQTFTAEELAAMTTFMTDLNKRLDESGELVETRGLAEPVHTRRLTGGPDGEILVTDGPYAETQEVLAGYWVLECDSFDRATEIAAEICKCPGAGQLRVGEHMDVRPITGSFEDLL